MRPALGLAAGLLLCLLVPPAHANDLMRLYRLASARDSTLQAAMYQRNAAVEARPLALSQWLPQLTGSASSERERLADPVTTSAVTTTGTPAPLGAAALPGCSLASSVTVRCDANYTTYGLTLSQTIWSYQAYSQLKEADLQAASAEAAYLAAQQALIQRLAQAYFAVLQDQDQLTTLTNERTAYGTLLAQTQARLKTGVGSASDAAQAQSFYDLTAQGVINARTALQSANFALAEIVGEPAGHVAPLREQIPLAGPDPDSVDAWVASAQQDNPDVRAAALAADAAKRDIGVQRGKGLPTVSLTGTGGRTSAPQVLGGNSALDTIGVYFQWPLFQGGAVAAEVRQARALYRQSEANLTGVQRQTEQQTRTAYLNVVNGVRAINAARRAVGSARAAVQAAQRDIEFNIGGGEYALLEYQGLYYSAQYAYDQARYSYLNNVLLLKQQAGQLAERDLVAIDALLVTDGSGG